MLKNPKGFIQWILRTDEVKQVWIANRWSGLWLCYKKRKSVSMEQNSRQHLMTFIRNLMIINQLLLYQQVLIVKYLERELFYQEFQ